MHIRPSREINFKKQLHYKQAARTDGNGDVAAGDRASVLLPSESLFGKMEVVKRTTNLN